MSTLPPAATQGRSKIERGVRGGDEGATLGQGRRNKGEETREKTQGRRKKDAARRVGTLRASAPTAGASCSLLSPGAPPTKCAIAGGFSTQWPDQPASSPAPV
eukprot:2623583-Prymnesium_polylepis.2